MARRTDKTIAEIKRSGFLFDPCKPQNWHAGILHSILGMTHKSDRIDLLAERTLKTMEIDTRGQRRQVILKLVQKAIRDLCSRNVLTQYQDNRVKLAPGLRPQRLSQYLDGGPQPWLKDPARTGSSTQPGLFSPRLPIAEGSSSHEGWEEEGGLNDDVPLEVGPTAPSPSGNRGRTAPPIVLPRLRTANNTLFEDRTEPDRELEEHADDRDDHRWHEEASSALNLLLGGGSADALGNEVSEPDGDTKLTGPGGGNLHKKPPARVVLKMLIDGILERDPSLQQRCVQARSAVLACDEDIEIRLEVLLQGDVRYRLVFPSDRLERVLRHLGMQWKEVPVGIDNSGRPAIQRAIAAGTGIGTIINRLLGDMQDLEDSAGPA